MENLSRDAKFTLVQAGLASGQTDPNSSSVDMAQFGSCTFVCTLQTIAATGTVSMQVEGSADDVSFAALTGAVAAATATDDDKLLIVEVAQPKLKHLRVALTRAVADSSIGGITAMQSLAGLRPTTHTAATLAAEKFVSGV